MRLLGFLRPWIVLQLLALLETPALAVALRLTDLEISGFGLEKGGHPSHQVHQQVLDLRLRDSH